jgi:hypothetical protein
MRIQLFVLCLIAFAFTAKGQDYFYKSTPERRKIIHLITSLPEISADYRHMKIITYIDKIPTAQNNHYTVAVAEDQGWRLHSRYFFTVDAHTYTIKYWAIGEGKDITLSVWRKHHYKDF